MVGILLINKPRGLTSRDCVNRIQKVIGDKSIAIGHAGSLDPFAEGLLIIGVGYEATRHLGIDLDKKYTATGKLGVLTDTLDKSGVMIESNEHRVEEEAVRNAIKSLGKEYMQVPPVYSALKHQGEPLYKLAREGIYPMEELLTIVQGKKKPIKLYNVQLISYQFPLFTISAHVSHGTYMRSLVNDIAQSPLCKSVATTFELQRTAVGPFNLEEAVELDQLRSAQDVEQNLISINDFLDRVHKHQKDLLH